MTGSEDLHVSHPTPPHVTIVADPGVDDTIALVLLDRLLPDAAKTLVSTFGNNSAAVTGRNAGQLAAHLGRRWVHRRGAQVPMGGFARRDWATDYHGPDGVWGVDLPGGETEELTAEQPVSSVISLAPLYEPLLLEMRMLVSEITIMGGCFAEAATRPEFNVGMDTMAASRFFELRKSHTPRVVPEDVTRRVRWSVEDVRSIPDGTGSIAWLKRMLMRWFEYYGTPLGRHFPLHDPVAAYLALHPEHAVWEHAGVSVSVGGRDDGVTRFSDDNPPCLVARQIDAPNHLADRLLKMICEL